MAHPSSVAEIMSVVTAHAAEVDAKAVFPVESLQVLRAHGYLGLLVPTQYAGMGHGLGELIDTARTLAAGCLSTAMIWAMHCQQTELLVRHAGPQLRSTLLPRIAAGLVYLASVTTESENGGNPLSVRGALVLEGSDVVIDRDAPVVTGGAYADGFLITMRDHERAEEHEVTLVYADRSDLDIEQTGDWKTMGMRGTDSVGLRLRGRVPITNIVGKRGRFREVAADSLAPAGHLAWSACWLGAAEAALSRLIRWLISKSNGKASLSSPLVLERIARIRLDLELVSAYLSKVRDEVAVHRVNGDGLDVPAMQIHLNTLKIASSELTFQAADRMVQLAGLSTGYGTRASAKSGDAEDFQ